MLHTEKTIEKIVAILLAEQDREKALNDALKVILDDSEVSRVYIFRIYRDADQQLLTDYVYEACAEGVETQVDNPLLKGVPLFPDFERWYRHFNEFKPVVGLVRNFPESERIILEMQHILSIVVLPIFSEGELCGFIGLDDTETERNWKADDIALLENTARLVGHFLNRVRISKTLDMERTRRSTLFDMSPIPMIESDRSFRILNWNRAAEQVFGYTRDEVLHKAGHFLVPEELREKIQDYYSGLLDSDQASKGKVWGITNEAIHKSGRRVLLEWRNTVIPDIDGHPSTVLSIARDITEREQQRKKLIDSERLYRGLYETMSDGVVYQNREGHIINANPAACEILGITLDQMQGRTSFHPEWRAVKEDMSPFAGSEHPAMVALQTGKPVFGHIMGIFHPGEKDYRWISINATPEFEENETEPFRVFTLFRDVTRERNLFDRLRRSRDVFLSFIENIRVGIWLRNEQNELVYSNKFIQDMFEGDPSGLFDGSSNRYLEYVHPEDRSIVGSRFRQHQETKQDLTFDYRLVRPDGSLRYVQLRLVTMQIPGDESAAYSAGFLTDLTDQKRSLEEMRRGREAAEQLSTLKSNILTSISHEFRSPLTGILGFATLLKSKSDDRENLEALDMIESSANRLYHVLESILSYASFDSSRKSMRPEEFDIETVLEPLLVEYAEKCDLKGLYLQKVFPENSVVSGDKNIVRSVVNELLDNAFKFTRQGGIRLCIKTDNDIIRIITEDTGIGIPAGSNILVFEPFHQSAETNFKESVGAGLGLPIIARQIELIGGSIRHEPTEHGGTRFIVEIPFMEEITGSPEG
jgi:PAS domain S-box-containing protein